MYADQCTAQGYFNWLNPNEIAWSTHDGMLISVGGQIEKTPYAGVIFTAPGTPENRVPNQTFDAFVYMDGAVMMPELVPVTGNVGAETTQHGANNADGVEVRNGYASRTLVGKCRTGADGMFRASAAEQFCISWFERKPLGVAATLKANKAVSGGTWQEVVSADFLSWGYDHKFDASGWIGPTQDGMIVELSLAKIVNGAADTDNVFGFCRMYCPSANVPWGFSVPGGFGVLEGYNRAALMARVEGGGTAVFGGGSGKQATAISGLTMG